MFLTVWVVRLIGGLWRWGIKGYLKVWRAMAGDLRQAQATPGNRLSQLTEISSILAFSFEMKTFADDAFLRSPLRIRPCLDG